MFTTFISAIGKMSLYDPGLDTTLKTTLYNTASPPSSKSSLRPQRVGVIISHQLCLVIC